MTLILCIDGDRYSSASLARFLTVGGFWVALAADGLDGVKKARALQPDLILLDLCLRRLDGLEVIKQLRGCSLTWEIPIILMSLFPAESSRVLVEQTGVQGFISKPLQADELVEVLEKQLPGCARGLSDELGSVASQDAPTKTSGTLTGSAHAFWVWAIP
jgi:DNA-binding response OmpR family regulator